MTLHDLLASYYSTNLDMIGAILADFSDADMLVRPCEGANHAAWQIGHLTVSEHVMVSACGGDVPALTPGFAEKFTRDAAKTDDPKHFPTKTEILAELQKVRQGSIAWMRTLTLEQLAQPGPERMRSYMPTLGSVVMMLGEHLTMHLGQCQVIRRKLGKPVLF